MNRVRQLFAHIAWVAFLVTDQQTVIEADVRRWAEIENRGTDVKATLIDLACERKEFRSLLHYRLYHGNAAGNLTCHVLFLFLKPQVSLYLYCDDIGPGLYLQHAFSTGVTADHVGKNVWLNHEVTIGATAVDGKVANPVIEDGATIYSGAKIIGPVRIGRNAVVGANAVVTKDVPDDKVAVGVPAVIRDKGRVAGSDDAPRA